MEYCENPVAGSSCRIAVGGVLRFSIQGYSWFSRAGVEMRGILRPGMNN